MTNYVHDGKRISALNTPRNVLQKQHDNNMNILQCITCAWGKVIILVIHIVPDINQNLSYIASNVLQNAA